MRELAARSSAMLVVEMQNDLVARCGQAGISGALSRAVAERGLIPKLAAFLDRCRAASVPVMYACKERHASIPMPTNAPIYAHASRSSILVTGTEGANVIDELKPHAEDIVLVRYTGIDPSSDSNLWNALNALQVATLIVAGVSTTLAVEGTVRSAANKGFRIVVLEDCCASIPDEWHEFSVTNILPLLAIVSSSKDVAFE
ncbi:MAG: cysteine hydrolase family protein [Actinomycetota bacterium]